MNIAEELKNPNSTIFETVRVKVASHWDDELTEVITYEKRKRLMLSTVYDILGLPGGSGFKSLVSHHCFRDSSEYYWEYDMDGNLIDYNLP